MKGLILGLLMPYFISPPIKADEHWMLVPPVPKLTIQHFKASAVIVISFISDSTFDRPIWYILEVKQWDDPSAEWWRPWNPLQGTNFNEAVTIQLSYRNAAGGLYPWFKAEMIRVRVMWGA